MVAVSQIMGHKQFLHFFKNAKLRFFCELCKYSIIFMKSLTYFVVFCKDLKLVILSRMEG